MFIQYLQICSSYPETFIISIQIRKHIYISRLLITRCEKDCLQNYYSKYSCINFPSFHSTFNKMSEWEHKSSGYVYTHVNLSRQLCVHICTREDPSVCVLDWISLILPHIHPHHIHSPISTIPTLASHILPLPSHEKHYLKERGKNTRQ